MYNAGISDMEDSYTSNNCNSNKVSGSMMSLFHFVNRLSEGKGV